MKVGVSLLLDIPGAITCLIYGPLSDKIGRKPLAVINSLGYVSFVIILLVIEYMQLSIKFIYLASLMIGLTGSYVSTSMVCFSYIADLYTEQKQKTVRLGKHWVNISSIKCFRCISSFIVSRYASQKMKMWIHPYSKNSYFVQWYLHCCIEMFFWYRLKGMSAQNKLPKKSSFNIFFMLILCKNYMRYSKNT